MRIGRVSIAGLAGLIAVAGLWMAALKVATGLWETITETVTLGLLMTAVLGAIFLRDEKRGFWAGFALFGLVYLVMVLVGSGFKDSGEKLTEGLEGPASWIHPMPTGPPGLSNGGGSMSAGFSPTGNQTAAIRYQLVLGAYYRQLRVCESITRFGLCLVFALVGGLVGRHFASEGAKSVERSGLGTSSAQGR